MFPKCENITGQGSSYPRLLDLFCGQGGASSGYSRAGFSVIGVDKDSSMLRRYPFQSFNMDWLNAFTAGLAAWPDVIAASPPCQHYSAATKNSNRHRHPDLIGPVREALISTGKPYIIENVPGAPLKDPVELCGCMFSLRASYRDVEFCIYRKRLFETNFPVAQPAHREHCWVALDVFGHGSQGRFYKKHGFGVPASVIKEAMGCPWMSAWDGISESIPPVFTEYIGDHAMQYLSVKQAA